MPDPDLGDWLCCAVDETLCHYFSNVAPPERSPPPWNDSDELQTFVRRVMEGVLKRLRKRLNLAEQWRIYRAVRHGMEQAREKVGTGRLHFHVKESKNAEKERAIAEGLRAGLSPLEAFARAGVPRSTGYRILRRPNRA